MAFTITKDIKYHQKCLFSLLADMKLTKTWLPELAYVTKMRDHATFIQSFFSYQ